MTPVMTGNPRLSRLPVLWPVGKLQQLEILTFTKYLDFAFPFTEFEMHISRAFISPIALFTLLVLIKVL
jgi:hypothetical protein